MANERNVARARLRHASRDASKPPMQTLPKKTPKGDSRTLKEFILGPDDPIYQEAGLGSAVRAGIKMFTRSKYPKRAPKGSSLEERISYRDARAKDLKKIRDKKKAKADAKKQDRLDSYRAKMAKKREKKATKPAPSPSTTPKWRDFGEEKRMARAYYERQRQVPVREAKANAAKRRAESKRPSAAERRAAEYRASADRIEQMQAGYKYRGGSGTRGGYRRGY